MKLITQPLNDMMVSWRHDLHQNPELGFQETRTAKTVANLLKSFGLQVYEEFGKTGVLGLLERDRTKKTIAIRADMDALPIRESSNLKYKSKNDGVMHACGHDGHTAILLGAAKYLSSNTEFSGNVIFIFQANEENGLGAKAMIDDGLFDRFEIEQIYALHNLPNMPAGYFATRENTITASESSFEITINTKGGHSALPNMGGDAILLASSIVTTIQSIVSRKIDPQKNAVISVTEFLTNGSKNVLASRVTLKGDIRTLNDDVRHLIKKELNEIATGICLSNNVKHEFKFDTKFPITKNASQPTQNIISSVSDMVGKERIDGTCTPMLFSEDFSFFTSKKPGCFVLIGNGTDGANAQPLHSSSFDFNDEILCLGSSLWVELAHNAFRTK